MAEIPEPDSLPTAVLDVSPLIHHIYSQTTATWQYVVADPSTSHCVVLDPVRDRCPEQASVSTSAADAVLDLIKHYGYIVGYILETHAVGPPYVSAAWYVRMQLSMTQGWPPQLCTDTSVSGLDNMWQRKYGAGSAFSRTIPPGLKDGQSVTVGHLALTCMRLPGFGTPHRRAYCVGKDVFGAHSIATLEEASGNAVTEHTSHMPESTGYEGEDDSDVEQTLQGILSLSGDTRVWHAQSSGSHPQPSGPFDSIAQCVAMSKHDNPRTVASLAEWHNEMRVRGTAEGLAVQRPPSNRGGLKARWGNWFSS